MPKYVTIPATPATVLNPDNDEPIGTASFADMIRNIFKDSRVTQGLDMFTAYDLRRELLSAKAGDVLKVPDEEHGVLAGCLKRPTVFSPAFLFSPEPQKMIRAFVDAPSEPPRPTL
jgi:hypothetical protein